MDQNVLIALAAAAPLVLLATRWLRGRGQSRTAPSTKPEALDTLSAWEPRATRVLTAPERRALIALHHALPEYIVLAQVPLARFISVPTRRSYAEWLRRVGQLSPDLIICDATTRILAAVEIRPPDAQLSSRAAARLERMRKVLKAADVPLHVWSEAALPKPEAIREVILANLPPSTTALPAAPTRRTPAAGPRATVHAFPQPAMAATATTSITSNPRFDPVDFDDEPDEIIEFNEPPPSTWFDDLDTRPAMPVNPARGSGGIGPR